MFSIISHPFWGVSLFFLETPIWMWPSMSCFVMWVLGVSGFPHLPQCMRLAQGLQKAILPMKRRPGKPNFCHGKKTRKTSECLLKRGHFKRKGASSNHYLSGNMLVFGRGIFFFHGLHDEMCFCWWPSSDRLVVFPNKRVSAVSIPSMHGIFTYIW